MKRRRPKTKRTETLVPYTTLFRSPTREPTGGIRKRERDRAERVRSEGSPKPSLKERAVAFARERGVIRTKDLTSIGIPRCYLSPMCDEGLLVRVGYGRYIEIGRAHV